jgi:hypothetical protein
MGRMITNSLIGFRGSDLLKDPESHSNSATAGQNGSLAQASTMPNIANCDFPSASNRDGRTAMRYRRDSFGAVLRLANVISIFVLAVASWSVARADSGREFAGTYTVSAITPLGAEKSRIQLTLHIQNMSSAPVSEAVVELDSAPPAPLAQSFPNAISAADRAFVTVSGAFTVSSRDADRWRRGGLPAPMVVVIGPDLSGKLSRRVIAFLPSPMGSRP